MSFFNELKRRNVLRVGAAYVVGAWLLIQVAETLFPLFGFDDTPARIVVIILAIAFVPALILAWVFELTPEGIKKDSEFDHSQSITAHTVKKLDRMIMVVLALALGLFAFERFILVPEQRADEIAQAHEQGRSEALVESYGDQSVAVLPFVDMSPQGSQEYFSDGLSEELLNLLAKIPELRVISRSSAFAFKGMDINVTEVAQKLNVAHILEGSVRKSGDQIRVTAQLIEARSDTHIWSETYDRKLENIFDIQDDIAASVVEQLKITLMGETPISRRSDPVAHDLLYQASHLLNGLVDDDSPEALNLIQQSLAIDPNNPDGWTLLAWAYMRLGKNSKIPWDEAKAQFYRAIDQALAIDSDLPDAYFMLASASRNYDADLQKAIRYLEKAMETNPGRLTGLADSARILEVLGRVDECIEILEYMIRRNPLRAGLHRYLGKAYVEAGRYDEGLASLRTALILGRNVTTLHYNIGKALLLKGDPEQALIEIEQEPFDWYQNMGFAMAYHALGRQSETEEKLAVLLEEPDNAFHIASVLAFQNKRDLAFEWLERHVTQDGARLDIANFALFSNLHDDPRWPPFLESIGQSPGQLAAITFDIAPALKEMIKSDKQRSRVD